MDIIEHESDTSDKKCDASWTCENERMCFLAGFDCSAYFCHLRTETHWVTQLNKMCDEDHTA